MNRKELLDMIVTGTAHIRAFIADIGADSRALGSFEDWNDIDAAGHIVGWMDYSIDKLRSLKLGTAPSQEYAGVSSLEEINRLLYGKTCNSSAEDIESAYLRSLGRYIEVVSLYSNRDLDLTTFNTGFDMALWRYMLMDTVIHPVQHALYQYLKRRDYARLADVAEGTASLFEAYTGSLDSFRLAEFGIERAECQEKLAEFSLFCPESAAVQAFVRANGV